MRLAVPDVVRFSVHDVPRVHTTSLHRCYRMALPYSTIGAVEIFLASQGTMPISGLPGKPTT